MTRTQLIPGPRAVSSGGSGGPHTHPESDVVGLTASLNAETAEIAGKVAKAGDTMTGPLTLSGDPTTDPQATNRGYVLAQIAAAIAGLVNSAPGTLDTLNEIAQALGDDPNFAATLTNALAGKVPTTRQVMAGTGLSGGGDLTADRAFAVAFGTTATTATVGNDARLSDTRTPTDSSVTDAKVADGIAASKIAVTTTGLIVVTHNRVQTALADLDAGILARVPISAVRSVTTTASANPWDLILADATTAGFTITLPTTPAAGTIVTIKKTDVTANAVTIGGTIDGVTNPTLTVQYQAIEVVYAGGTWQRVIRPPLGNLADVSAGSPSDGQSLLWQASTLRWIAGNPAVSGNEAGYAENVTGTTQDVGPGTTATVDVANCTLSIVGSATRPFWVEGSVRCAVQTQTGTPSPTTTPAVLQLVDTTSGNVVVETWNVPVPGATGTSFVARGKVRIGTFTGTRTYKLVMTGAGTATNGYTIRITNTATVRSWIAGFFA